MTALAELDEALTGAGHRVRHGEAVLHLDGAGIEVRSVRPGPTMPAAGVALTVRP